MQSGLSQPIEVAVEVQYLQQESAPDADRYVFAYTITISNHSSVPSQLLNRHWIITDGRGDVQEVAGPGVIGQQPWLAAGEQFTYSSGAVLKTPVGTMQGSYEFRTDSDERFDVPIEIFSLRVANMVH
ncbi:MAG: Co2+/Mg2+ efflux protein ApaG [Proteobacteria bacterium]|nr:Co2+/Mg2+ efflux protein ApaG [Pseudomonadota bacterium]